MRSWIPVPGTTKARLVDAALAAFGTRGFDRVAVSELAEAAGVTTGSIYHHFGSKLGLYDLVRSDVEQRLVDRMAGAAAAQGDAVDAARVLLVGYDYLVGAGFARMLSEPHPERAADPVEAMLATLGGTDAGARARILTAALRAALGLAADADAASARAALGSVIAGQPPKATRTT